MLRLVRDHPPSYNRYLSESRNRCRSDFHFDGFELNGSWFDSIVSDSVLLCPHFPGNTGCHRLHFTTVRVYATVLEPEMVFAAVKVPAKVPVQACQRLTNPTSLVTNRRSFCERTNLHASPKLRRRSLCYVLTRKSVRSRCRATTPAIRRQAA